MALKVVDDANITALANEIRSKSPTQGKYEFPQGFIKAIKAIPTGGGGSTGIQMASGRKDNYTEGVLSVTDIGFRPKIVIVCFDALVKNKEATLFTAAIDSDSLLNNSQSLENIKAGGIGANYTFATTEKQSATFSDYGFSLIPISSLKNTTISNVRWWAFGGFSI